MSLDLLPLAGPLPLLLVALASLLTPGRRPGALPAIAEGAAFLALLVAGGSLVLLFTQGASTSALIGVVGVGLSARIDAVSATMLTLVGFVGWVVVRFSRTYLDGEARE